MRRGRWAAAVENGGGGTLERRSALEAALALFTSTYVNKVDKKGRVSVPASFRLALAGQTFNGVAVYPSFVYAAIDGSGIDLMESLAASVDQFDPFSDEHGAFATTIFGRTQQLPFDTEGRIVLSPALLSHAEIDGAAAFLGRGTTFQIWEPEALKVYTEEAVDRARADRAALRRTPPGDAS